MSSKFPDAARMSGGGNHSFSFRRDELDRTPFTPIPFDERPDDRPLAEDLGNGRNYSGALGPQQTGKPGMGKWTLSKVTGPTYWRKAVGMKLFSWEGDA